MAPLFPSLETIDSRYRVSHGKTADKSGRFWVHDAVSNVPSLVKEKKSIELFSSEYYWTCAFGGALGTVIVLLIDIGSLILTSSL